MTQAEMERELAGVTGETVSEIRHRGFSLVVMPSRPPLTVNWDALQQAERPRRYVKRPRHRERLAA
jgi:hypothetical protein